MAATDVVYIPDRRASLLVRLVIQNQGSLLKSKRPPFAEISDRELEAIEAAIQRVLAESTRGSKEPVTASLRGDIDITRSETR